MTGPFRRFQAAFICARYGPMAPIGMNCATAVPVGQEVSMRYRFVEARKRVGDIHGFLVPGDREEAAVEIRRLLRDWPGDLVDLGGQRVPTSTIDPVSIVIGHESDPPDTRSQGGIPRYAIDGTFIDGLEGA